MITGINHINIAVQQMASQQKFIDYILDQIAEAGSVSAKKMFGEYAIYCDGKVVAFFCDDQLFVKPTAVGKAFIGTFEEGYPYPKAKPHLLISDEKWDDQDFMTKLMKISAEALPMPKTKIKRQKN